MIENYLKNIVNQNEEELSIDDKINLITNYINDEDILLKNISNIFLFNNDIIKIKLNENVIKDLNIFNSNDLNNNSVFNNIDKTNTLYGKYILKYWISSPTIDVKLLKNRQRNIKTIVKNTSLFNNLTEIFNNIKTTESKVLWFWDKITDETKSLYDIVFFDIPYISNFLNNNNLILNVANIYKIFLTPTFSIFIPILSIILPYLLLVIFNKRVTFNGFIKFVFNILTSTPTIFNILPPQYGTKAKYFSLFLAGIYGLLYIQSGYYSLRSAIDTNKIIKILYYKISTIYNIFKNVINMRKIIDENKIKLNTFIDDDIEYFTNLFDSDILDTEYKLFNNKGKILSMYYNFINNKDKFINILKYIGEVDVYLSLSKLYNDHKNSKNKYCFVKYIKSNKPYVSVKDIWHPNLNKNPTTNDIILGRKNKNLLITGPNKSGKSIFIKSLATSIIFSQTIGITPAFKFTSTPFKTINSYLHIPDITGKASLFEAEMYRAKDHIVELNNMKDNEFSFIIMDEIFTSTNYIEGYSAAYSICKKLSNYNNSISIITTHFTGLNKIEKETNGNIVNYKFMINRDKDNNIIYEHKLRRGYSKQYIALELLKNNNFDKDVIDNAIKMCNTLKKDIK